MNFNQFFIVTIFAFCLSLESEAQSNETSQFNGNWQTLECVGTPVARHENCFVEVNDKFYLLGGRGIKVVNIFDPKTNTWTAGAKPPIELHHFQGVSYKGKIYVIGAMTGKYPDEKPLSNILTYDPKTDKWSEGDEIPENRRRGSSGVVVVKNKALIFSGIVDGHNGTHVTWVDEYNFKSGKWEQLADAPRPRDHFAAVMKDGKIYCAGGRNTSEDTKQTFELTIGEVDIYDLKNDSWESLPESQSIPTQRAGTSTVIMGDDMIVIGGESGSQPTAHNEVEALSLKTLSWRKLTNLERGRHGTQAILYKNATYIVAGSGNRGGKPELDTIEKFQMTD